MTKTSENTWIHKGWGIEYYGNGYRLTRIKPVNGKFIHKTSKTLKQAAIIINNEEADIIFGKEK